jgi:two-component system sensor kinase FixL
VVLIDTLEIQLVLVNLLQNAVQSMEYKGDKVVSIETRRIDDQTIQISIADRGPGIDPERIEDIFEPLYSGNGEGMGMGLAICRIIVEAHGGHIGYRPNPSGGAIFQFTVRLAAA